MEAHSGYRLQTAGFRKKPLNAVPWPEVQRRSGYVSFLLEGKVEALQHRGEDLVRIEKPGGDGPCGPRVAVVVARDRFGAVGGQPHLPTFQFEVHLQQPLDDGIVVHRKHTESRKATRGERTAAAVDGERHAPLRLVPYFPYRQTHDERCAHSLAFTLRFDSAAVKFGKVAGDRQADTLWRVLELEAGMLVLDLACGHGRIANRLAARGAVVTGLDATGLFLEEARKEAQARGVEVDYVEGDMRDLRWTNRFDAAVSIFTSFGYFDDDVDRRVLNNVRQVLKSDGRFCVEVNNLAWLLTNFREHHVIERDGNWMIDRTGYDPMTGRAVTSRTVIRDGQQRTFEFSVRLFTFTELRDWLVAAGFSDVVGYSGRGEELTVESPRMLLVART